MDPENVDPSPRRKTMHACILAAAWSAGCSLFPDFGRLQGKAESHDAGVDGARPDANAPAIDADAHATKPVVTCPGVGSPAYMKAPAPATSAGFGSILATDGDTLVVVAPMEGAASTNVPEDIEPDMICPTRALLNPAPGAIYAYVRNGDTWPGGRVTNGGESLISRAVTGMVVSGNNVFSQNNFALTSVKLTDRWMITGEAGDPAGSKGGSVTFFERSAPFRQVFKYIEPRTSLGDGFGYSFALSGSTLVVGAPRSVDDASVAGGGVFVYEIKDESISFVRKIVSPNSQEDGLFGARVALSDGWLVVGATNEPGIGDFGGTDGVGAAYAFPRSGDGKVQSLPVNGALDRVFGTTLALDGSTLLVGAPGSSGCSERQQYDAAGAIHHYELEAGVWREVECLSANSVQSGFFGYSLALTADRLVVGAPFSWNGDPLLTGKYKRAGEQLYGASAGLVYMFDRSGGRFHPTCTLMAPNGEACDAFGEDVAIGKDVLAVGAFGEDGEGNAVMDSGSVYLYPLSPVAP
jgi:FG-GAP repeat